MNIQTAITELEAMNSQFVHGHTLLREITDAVIAQRRERDALLDAAKMAYSKHHLGIKDIGWHQLSDKLLDVLCEALTDDGFRRWVDSLDELERDCSE